MKIGIDAFFYFDGYSSAQRVTYNLIYHLLINDLKNEYVLFADKRFQNNTSAFPSRKNLSIRYLRTGSLRYNLFLKLFILPYYSFRDKIDLMITQYYPSPFSHGKSAAFVFDILYETYPELYTSRERYQLWPQKFLTRLSNYVITISESEKNRLLKHRYAKLAQNVVVFPLAADIKFKPKSYFSEEKISEVKVKYNLPESFLLYVGLLSGRKNLDNLLRALPMLSDAIPLVITGHKHPTYPSKHLDIIKELGLEKQIHFTGFVDDSDLSIIYSLAKVFCFPSYAEGFGLPPLEALSSGVPVAVSDRTSLPEVCGESGVYFNPESPDSIAKAIDSLLTNPAYYENRKATCLSQASKFDWNVSANTLIKFLNSINANN